MQQCVVRKLTFHWFHEVFKNPETLDDGNQSAMRQPPTAFSLRLCVSVQFSSRLSLSLGKAHIMRYSSLLGSVTGTMAATFETVPIVIGLTNNGQSIVCRIVSSHGANSPTVNRETNDESKYN